MGGGSTYAAAPSVAMSGVATRRRRSTPATTRRTPSIRYVQSFEPGEDWFWDYKFQRLVEGPVLTPPHDHPLDQPTPGPAGRVPRDWQSKLH